MGKPPNPRDLNSNCFDQSRQVMASHTQTGSFTPAPYGRACLQCARAKCKCFSRPEGAACERCHRLGKYCEPGVTNRKRKAASPQSQQPSLPPPPPAPSSRLEDKLDDLVSILRTQVEKQVQVPELSPQSTLRSESICVDTLSNYSKPVRNPEVLIDADSSSVQFLRANNLPPSQSTILEDVSVHHVPEFIAEERLATFRRAFLPMFPFVHIPSTLKASELRYEKPFLWLSIMALSTTMISQQFAMENTIWQIISQRIVVQHFADLDLLLGLICFASWSHYFKKDKPFMTTLAQLAVSLAYELGIHGDIPQKARRRGQSSQNEEMPHKRRSLEERRSMLAVYHLTSATWAAYRKTEPIRWTPYLDVCLLVVGGDGARIETRLDAVLAAQVKCHLTINELLLASPREDTRHSSMVTTVLLRQINDIRQTLPVEVRSLNIIQLYLHNAELSVRESILRRPHVAIESGIAQRVGELDSILTSIEGWLNVFMQMPPAELVGIQVDNFTQFLHCIVVLFKLTTIEETGWDINEVKRRADVFEILDRTGQQIESVPGATGMVDAGGPRSGLFFKAKYLWQAIKALLAAEMPPNLVPADSVIPQAKDRDAATLIIADDFPMNDFLNNLADEPWLSDIFTYDWTGETFIDGPFEP